MVPERVIRGRKGNPSASIFITNRLQIRGDQAFSIHISKDKSIV